MARDWTGEDKKPTAQMTVVTRCERVQPVMAGVDEKGELIWEGREMARWQMEMFRIARDLFHFVTQTEWGSRWYELARYQEEDREHDSAERAHFQFNGSDHKRLNELRRMYQWKGKEIQKKGD